MKFAFFYHSLQSCWNHGNAHFLRGVVRELAARGHDVTVFEPADGWSRTNAMRENAAGLPPLEVVAPGIASVLTGADFDPGIARSFDVVIVNEWNDPALVAALGFVRRARGGFVLLFHDTHHRAITAPHEIDNFDLDACDGVLAFGRTLADVYRRRRDARRVFVWHEAADVTLFRPDATRAKDCDLVWIGNWGDGERDEELRAFLIRPIRELGLKARLYGVRYPETALRDLRAAGVDYRGWLPNHRAPEAFASARMTVHVPRRPYAAALRGIPTIRMFEALACGIPMVSAPWEDSERLFEPGAYLRAADGDGMIHALARLRDDDAFARATAMRGLACVRNRHTCGHRVDELLSVVESLRGTDRADDAVEGAAAS